MWYWETNSVFNGENKQNNKIKQKLVSWQRAASVSYQQRTTNATKVYVVRLFIACQLAEFRKVWNAGNEPGDASRPRTKSLIVCYSTQLTAFTHSLGVRIFGTTHRESLTAQNMHVQKHRFEMKNRNKQKLQCLQKNKYSSPSHSLLLPMFLCVRACKRVNPRAWEYVCVRVRSLCTRFSFPEL